VHHGFATATAGEQLMQYCTQQPSSAERPVDIHHRESSQLLLDRTVRLFYFASILFMRIFTNKQTIHCSEY